MSKRKGLYSICMFLLQEPSDIDIMEEYELCDSPVEFLQVRLLCLCHCG